MSQITGDMLREASTHLVPNRSFNNPTTLYVIYSCVAVQCVLGIFAGDAYNQFLISNNWCTGSVLSIVGEDYEEQQNIRFMLLHFVAEAIDSGDLTITY